MKRTLRVLGLMVLAAGTLVRAGQAPPATQQTPTFKAEVEYVEVDALVTDAQGHVVRNLTKDDFQVFEDGKPQSISAFTFVDIPIERYDRPLYAAQPIEPDVRSNARPFDGRVYVMVIDDLHTAALRSQLVKKAARQFIEQNLGANDLMAVIHTAGPTDASQEFTNSKRLLLAAVDKTMGRKVTSETLNKTDEYYRTKDFRQQTDPINDPDEAERGYNARSTLTALKNVADWFANVHGRRKSILFVSEGIDYDITDIIGNYNGPGGHGSAQIVLDAMRDLIASAQHANVSIYGIDPRGLTSLADEDITVGSYPDDPSLRIGRSSLLNEVRLSQDSLLSLSDETGGFAVVNRNQFGGSFQRIVEDNSSYYVLAYYPASTKRDGKFHKIEVRVARPGLSVRSRRGYVAPKGKPAAKPADAKSDPALRDALNSPLPVSGLTLQVFAAPFRGPGANASVLFGTEVLGRDMKIGPNDKLALSYMAIDANDKVRGANTDTLTFNVKAETKARIEQTGIRLLNRLDLPPGRYQLRVAARETGGDVLGSVLYDLEIPDFTKGPLTMSGIVMTSISGSMLPTARPDEELKQVLPAPPIGIRAFPPGDEINLFAEIYDNAASKPHKVDITTTVTTDEGKVVYKTDDVRDSADLQGKRGGYGYAAKVPLKDLAPGSYVLTVSAHSRLGSEATAERQVRFVVAPAQGAPR